jgi:Domain of unknown function (DUF4126)
MDPITLLGRALGVATIAGINLYLTTLLIGISIRFNLIHLHESYQSLAVLANPWILGASAVLFGVEFFADKIPWVDSMWDAIHTVVRPIGGALLAMQTLGAASPEMAVLGMLIGAAASVTTHAAKAGVRVLANTSPEPLSNIALSVGEDALVAIGAALVLKYPVVSLFVCTTVILLLWMILTRIFRKIGGIFALMSPKRSKQRLESLASKKL